MSTSNLFEEFRNICKAEWLNKVVKDQKGIPIEPLGWDFEGINVSPFYHSEDLPDDTIIIKPQAPNNAWHIGEYFDTSDPIVVNKALTNALELGVSAIYVDIKKDTEVHLSKVFSGIQHEWISTHLDLRYTDNPLHVIESFCNVIKAKSQNSSKVMGSVRLNKDDETYWQILEEVFRSLPKFRVALNPQSDGKKGVKTELLSILISTYDFFQGGQEKDIDLNVLFDKMQYLIHIGDDYYKNIILLRSVRLLVNQLCNAYNVSNSGSTCIETWLKESDQSENSNYNLIKNTSQILSAVIGGSDYVYSTCYMDSCKKTVGDKRLQRNISHVLQLESYLDRVVDPAAGSYFFESMTDQFCNSVWQEFQNRSEA